MGTHGPADGMPATTTEAHGGEEHVTPSALGFDATMLVALAMLVVIALAIWKKVPAMIAARSTSRFRASRRNWTKPPRCAPKPKRSRPNMKPRQSKPRRTQIDMKAAAEEEAKLIVARPRPTRPH